MHVDSNCDKILQLAYWIVFDSFRTCIASERVYVIVLAWPSPFSEIAELTIGAMFGVHGRNIDVQFEFGLRYRDASDKNHSICIDTE